MTEREQKEVRSYCAFLLHKYGFDFSPNDPVIPALFVIHKDMELSRKANEQLTEIIRQAMAKVKPQEFHFKNDGEAFKFQLGAAVKWILMGMFVLMLSLIGVWYWNQARDVRQADEILKSSKEVRLLVNRVQKDSSGNYFIDFSSAEIKKLTLGTTRVNLGKESDQ